MIMRKLIALVLGVGFTLLSLDCALAMTSESPKKAAEIDKEIIGTPPSVEERSKAIQGKKKKGTTDKFFNELDGDKDNKVSLDEFLVPMRSRFKSIDSNQDGVITREEFEISFEKHQKTRIKSMRKRPGGTMPNRMPPQMPPK
ncbi:MAG: EF-hand domain-containing protein [Deltaproteobacteria bacterium]|nr:EF-hand domain-containing protein [Deltaproteobacteria bacterium]